MGRRSADTADLVRREEAAAAFEAGQAQARGGLRLGGRPLPPVRLNARDLLLLAGIAAQMSCACGWQARV